MLANNQQKITFPISGCNARSCYVSLGMSNRKLEIVWTILEDNF